jgi:nicotinamidase-related amidase
MDTAHAALVVVDVQNGFLNHHSRPVLPALSRLLAAWTQARLPVVLTRYHNYPGSQFEHLLHWSRLQDSPETDIAEEISVHTANAAVIDKYGYSCFTDDFRKLLDHERWRDLYFCGVATESCVLKSAADAFEHGVVPWIVTDASASDAGRSVHEAGLTVARRLIGAHHLVSSQDMLSGLLPSAAPRRTGLSA